MDGTGRIYSQFLYVGWTWQTTIHSSLLQSFKDEAGVNVFVLTFILVEQLLPILLDPTTKIMKVWRMFWLLVVRKYGFSQVDLTVYNQRFRSIINRGQVNVIWIDIARQSNTRCINVVTKAVIVLLLQPLIIVFRFVYSSQFFHFTMTYL